MPVVLCVIQNQNVSLAASEAGRSLPNMMVTAGVLLITVCTVSLLLRRMKQRAHAHHDHRPHPMSAALRRHAEIKQSIESLMVEAEELVRRLAGHLDNKAARLEILLKESDERVSRLSAASASRATLNESSVEPHPPARNGHLPEPRSIDPISREVYRFADEGLTSVDIARRLGEGIGKVELILALRDN